MPFQIQSLPLQGFDLTNPQSVKVFQTNLAQILSQIQSVLNQLPTSQSILNGSGAINSTALSPVNTSSTVTTSQSISCSNATMVALYYILNSGAPATWTLTMHNVPVAVPVIIWVYNNSGSSVVIKFAATDANNNVLGSFFTGSSGTVSMVSTGLTATNGQTHAFSGGLYGINAQLNFLGF